MACLACGWPGETDAHVPDCWAAYITGDRNRAAARQCLEQLSAVRAERDALQAQMLPIIQAAQHWAQTYQACSAAWASDRDDGDDWGERMGRAQRAHQEATEALLAALGGEGE